MRNEITQKFNKNIFANTILAFTVLWALSWLLPWTMLVESFPWVRLVISLIIFIAPGMAISLLIAGQRFNLSTHFTSGLAISVFLVSLLGLIGRIIKLPFDSVKLLFALIGLIGLIFLIKQFYAGNPLYKSEKFSPITLILLPILFFSFSYSLFNKNGGLGGDNYTYLAYLTNWQHAQPLNFTEIIYGSGTADWMRFWLTLFPMTTALLASISNLHGILLLGFYLEPCLVVIAILSIYNLYDDLLESKYLAISAVLLHFAFLLLLQGSLQQGGMFFHRTSEDKAFAGFILVPMFFLAVRFLLEKLTRRSILFFFLVGAGVEFVHPVILAYAIFIAGFYISLATISQKKYREFIVISTFLVLLILPSASLRFIDAPWVSKNLLGLNYDLRKPGSFDLEAALHTGSIDNRISYIDGTPFYGFTPDKIKLQIGNNKRWLIFLSWSYLWILLIGFVWSLINVKKHPTIAPFIAATCLLILVCLIPYTGWLMGYLVSARLLWRAPWLLPIGLISVVLLNETFKFASAKMLSIMKFKIPVEYVTSGMTFAISLVMISYFYTHTQPNWYSTEKFEQSTKRLSDLAKVGDYIEKNVEQPSVFVAENQSLQNLLPGLSSKAKILYFRNIALSPYPVELNKINELFSPNTDITLEQRVDTLNEYHIEYFLTQQTQLKNYFIGNPQFIAKQNISGYWIIQFQKAKP